MLKKILQYIQEGNFNQATATEELKISQDVLKMAMEQLAAMGYLKEERIPPNCYKTDCSACGSTVGCNKFFVYTLTPKGRDIR